MNFRILNYFLTVAKEQNITKAAELLHITQPTLSRQLTQLEDELGVQLFQRSSHKLILTEAGNMLLHRGKDILELVEKTELELKDTNKQLNGNICIGAGELHSVKLLSYIISAFRHQHPQVTFDLITNTADVVKEKMEKGLIDIALLVEPIDMVNYNFLIFPEKETLGVYMRKDMKLADKENIAAEDLQGKEILLPSRLQVRSQILNWLSGSLSKINIVGTSNLLCNTKILVEHNGLYAIAVYAPLDNDNICFKPLAPSLDSSVFLAWRRNVQASPTVQSFIQFAQCFLSMNATDNISIRHNS